MKMAQMDMQKSKKSHPSMTKGLSNNTPFVLGLAQAMQLERSSPLPPPTSMIHLAPFQLYASFRLRVPPCKLCRVKYVMACENSSPKAALSCFSPYCRGWQASMSAQGTPCKGEYQCYIRGSVLSVQAWCTRCKLGAKTTTLAKADRRSD